MQYEQISCFCGENARIVICGVGVYVTCPYCGSTTMMQSTKEEAEEEWDKIQRRKRDEA